MSSTVNIKAVGLVTQPNNLQAIEGALQEASNVIIRRDNVIESRRGFKLYGNGFGSSSDVAKQILSYKNTLIRHYDTTLQYDDGNGIFNSFTGSFTEPVAGIRIRSVESNGNFYFTTDSGVQKLSSKLVTDIASSTIGPSGGVKALDVQSSLSITLGDSSGFMPVDSAVAYRVVWGIKDSNANLILGTPSPSNQIYNPLSSLIAQDINNLLLVLDKTGLAATAELLGAVDYENTLKVSYTAAGTDLQTSVIALGAKLDSDMTIAAASGAPLTITSASISAPTCSIVLSATAASYITTGSKIFLSGFTGAGGLLINGLQTVTATGSTITFTTSVTGAITTTGAAVQYGEYHYILQTPVPGTGIPAISPSYTVDTPATHAELEAIQDALSRIMNRLKLENSAMVNPAALAEFIYPLQTTISANVQLEFTIPDDVTTNHFYQVYRSSIETATGVTTISDIAPGEEFQLAYEGFPTDTSAQYIRFIDVTPDAFLSTNLYTNPSTGEGILQANDVPPACNDINKFKNYTFYANTRTRHRFILNMLGIQPMLDDAAAGKTPRLTIANDAGATTYKFITGVNQVTNILCVINTNHALNNKYFNIYSSSNNRAYYVWYASKGTTATDPAPSGKIGIRVNIANGAIPAAVADATRDALNSINIDFKAVTAKTVTYNINNVNIISNVVTVNNHGLFNGDNVRSSTTDGGLSTATDYMIKNVTTNTFEVWNSGGTVIKDLTTLAASQTLTWTVTAGTLQNVNTSEGSSIVAANGAASPGFTITTLVTGVGEDIASNQVLLSSQASVGLATDATARSLVKVINRSTSGIYAYYLSGTNDVPGKILLESRVLGTAADAFYTMMNNSACGAAFNPDLSPGLQVNTIAYTNATTVTITTVGNHVLFNGDQILLTGTQNATTTALAIDGIYTITKTLPDAFTITKAITNATYTLATNDLVGVTYLPDAHVSDNEVKPNRMYYSKVQQPEAVPLVNYLDLGAGDKAILRILPLRDSLFVFKEDGLFRVSGVVAPFNSTLFDVSCLLLAPDSLGIVNNVIYGWTRKGIENITESGSQTISRYIDTDILPKATHSYSNFTTSTFGVGYESDNSYIVWTVKEKTDTIATVAYRYSNLTNSWTTYDKTNTCGFVSGADDKLYLGAGDINYIEQERKDFERTDYADREYTKILTTGFLTNSGKNLRFGGGVSGFEVGDVIVQNQTVSIYNYNSLLLKLDSDPGVGGTDYYSSLMAVAGDNMRSKLIALANKLDVDSGTTYNDYTVSITGTGSYSTSITSIDVSNPAVIHTSAAHGLLSLTLPFEGRWINISGTNTNASTVGTFEITYVSPTSFSVASNVIDVTSGVGTLARLENDERDTQACFNIIVSHLNIDPTVTFYNYDRIQNATSLEATVTAVNIVAHTITVNTALDFVVGNILLYKHINTQVVYTPQTMGDPLGLKQVREATIMFEDKSFTNATLSFSSDLIPEFVGVTVTGNGNGLFGNAQFGAGLFGGGSNSAPFRTYIPRDIQRCRFINVKFNHGTAREKYSIFGITLTGEIGMSTRGYR